MDISVIIPVYYNEGSIRNTFLQISEILKRNKDVKDYEVIFIDDGSEDSSLDEILKLKDTFSSENIKAIKFTKNFGQISAIRAGYSIATGKAVINISADLQDPPSLINKMIEIHLREKYEVVICTREAREESYFRRKTSSIFYKLMRYMSFKNMPEGGFDFVLISDKVKKALLNNSESNPFWQGQILYLGYGIKFIPYTRQKRETGVSRWTFSKKIKYLIDGVLSYSYLPVRLMSLIGLIVSLFGFIYAIVIVIAWYYGNVPFSGYAPIMVLVLVLSGFQMLMLGIIGEYLWRTLDQVRSRPPYIIEKIYE
ncbi:MAG: glycosyltransferase family 2 protein [Ignavibacteriaceae bacterium]